MIKHCSKTFRWAVSFSFKFYDASNKPNANRTDTNIGSQPTNAVLIIQVSHSMTNGEKWATPVMARVAGGPTTPWPTSKFAIAHITTHVEYTFNVTKDALAQRRDTHSHECLGFLFSAWKRNKRQNHTSLAWVAEYSHVNQTQDWKRHTAMHVDNHNKQGNTSVASP